MISYSVIRNLFHFSAMVGCIVFASDLRAATLDGFYTPKKACVSTNTPAQTGTCLSAYAQFSQSENDFFQDGTHLEGTNITYKGSLVSATLEPGEPNPGYSNSIWVSWTAPDTGRTRILPGGVQVLVYTGLTLGDLQCVRVVSLSNGRDDFLAIKGLIYHFQISGNANECDICIQLFKEGECSNDSFVKAQQLAGSTINWPEEQWFPISDASSEPGEPAQLDVPFRSIWWKWTAPSHGNATFDARASLATNVTLACYQGDRIEALRLCGRGTNILSFQATGGNVFYISAAVPVSALGDVLLKANSPSSSVESRNVSGNLLQEPSWEGTAIKNARYWGRIRVGGMINHWDGCDGTTWPTFGAGSQVWQDIPTIAGRNYRIRFAMRAKSAYVGGGSGDARVQVLWDNQEVGVAVLPEGELEFWHWADLSTQAYNQTSRVAFVNLGRNMEMDAYSVVALNDSPSIVNQPVSLSVVAGGTAAFIVGASGSPPLTYKWFHNDGPLATAAEATLLVDVSTNHAGKYHVIVSNPFGAVTSAPVTLSVEVPSKPVILWQPYGDTVGQGGAYRFSVVAAGEMPLKYQWFKNAAEIEGANASTLAFTALDFTNAGVYAVHIENSAGTVLSLGARLVVSEAVNGGGKIYFRNRFASTNVDSPVFDIDGTTRLSGSNYLAQLYAGSSLELLRPVGEPSCFRSGLDAGYFDEQTVIVPMVAPQSNAVVQVRAWNGTKGNTFEEARAFGGESGKSGLISLTLGGGNLPPAHLVGLRSFSLEAGRPPLAAGKIKLVGREPGAVVVWAHTGEPGFRYIIEKSIHGFDWCPFQLITNLTTTATFTDSANSGSSATFYRSRILD